MCQQVRKCNKCGKDFPLTEEFFTKNQSTNTGGNKYYRPDCKVCNTKMTRGKKIAYQKAGKPKPPNYGYDPITKKTTDGYPCDKCKKTYYSKQIVFDHDHETLNHRGWLCDGCNRSIGMMGDNIVGVVEGLVYVANDMTLESLLEIVTTIYTKNNS